MLTLRHLTGAQASSAYFDTLRGSVNHRPDLLQVQLKFPVCNAGNLSACAARAFGRASPGHRISELIRMLLKPLGAAAGDRQYCVGIYDYRVEQAMKEAWQLAPKHAILLFDGIFLQRPELFDYWDVRIFLQIDFETSVARAAQRDQYLFGTEAQTRERYLKRYVPGQRIYLESVHPAEKADILIDHRDPQNPRMLR